MGYNLDIVNPIENPKWDDLLLSSEGYSFFHSSFWARTLLESYNFTPRYFARTYENRLSVLVPMMEVNNAPLRKKGGVAALYGHERSDFRLAHLVARFV